VLALFMSSSSGRPRAVARAGGRSGASSTRVALALIISEVAVQQRHATKGRVTFARDRVQGRNAHFRSDSDGSDPFACLPPDRRRRAYIGAAQSETKRAGEGRLGHAAPPRRQTPGELAARAPPVTRSRSGRHPAPAFAGTCVAGSPLGRRPMHVGWSGHRLGGMLEAGCFAAVPSATPAAEE